MEDQDGEFDVLVFPGHDRENDPGEHVLGVLCYNAISTLARAVMQPLLFVFVFAYVLPKIGACIVFPIVLFVHPAEQAPHVHVTNWALLVIFVFGATMTSSPGLLLGMLADPRKMQTVILLSLTMLGCVYYPRSALHTIQWLQIATLVNPMVHMAEGLRAVLTPSLGHMPLRVVFFALVGGTALFGYLAPGPSITAWT
jgi:ABC-2 type transport system permease protein